MGMFWMLIQSSIEYDTLQAKNLDGTDAEALAPGSRRRFLALVPIPKQPHSRESATTARGRIRWNVSRRCDLVKGGRLGRAVPWTAFAADWGQSRWVSSQIGLCRAHTLPWQKMEVNSRQVVICPLPRHVGCARKHKTGSVHPCNSVWLPGRQHRKVFVYRR